jgi:cellulose synthase/poly-beta-1,6-N-acetylglucosamine synthase-like glycosyltransferase
MIASVILIVSLALIVYTYAGYPALVYVLSRAFGRRVKADEIAPKISVIIAAYNEEHDIARKIEETLALDYPCEKLEIIVASDCSTDRTDEIVKGFAGRGVILHRRPERLGKTSAQNHAVQVSTGEVLVFSDATTRYEANTLRKIVRSFADPEVGCVTGNVVYVDRSATAVGMGLRSYWGYEFFIKQCESRLGSLLGVCGCLYAVRRSAYVQLDPDMSSDFVIASEIHLQGLRTVYDAEAVSSEDTNKRSREEFRMRVRIIEQTMSALYRYRRVLNLRKHKMFAFQMICHKALRYAVPFLLVFAFIANLPLIGAGAVYSMAMIGQAVFYMTAVIGWLADGVGLKLGPVAFPYYFVLSNAASLVAFKKFISGQSHVTWEPTRESKPAGQDADYRTPSEGLIDGRSAG